MKIKRITINRINYDILLHDNSEWVTVHKNGKWEALCMDELSAIKEVEDLSSCIISKKEFRRVRR